MNRLVRGLMVLAFIGTVTMPLMAPGGAYADPTNKLDARFTKTIKVGRTRLQGSLDISTSSIRVPPSCSTLDTARTGLQPTQVLGARLFRLARRSISSV